MNDSFSLVPSPMVYFGAGKISVLPSVLKTFGSRALLITGAQSFRGSSHHQNLLEEFHSKGIGIEHLSVSAEPTPGIVDEAVKKTLPFGPDVIVAIGGGSVLDAGKAIAAMLPLREPVKNYLEGVGTKSHPGTKIAFIAIPTTAGTGSEAAKNAVLSETGENGYKRSLRHNNFVPNVAIIDPALSISCPQATTAASGMDAFTQLLESYLSTAGNSVTDALAHEGLQQVSRSLRQAYDSGTDVNARTGMALAAFLSGITLTNAGLGLVHGFAASIGGYFPIAHGVICSSLMSAVNRVSVRKLRSHRSNDKALAKYAVIGKMFAGVDNKSSAYYVDFLLDTIEKWTREMNIARPSQGGVVSSEFTKIVNATDNKNNPVALSKEEMLEILELAG
jgi:alcohol dehydrogenase class IV